MPAAPEVFVEGRPPQLGETLGDRFQVVAYVGRGGMSLVYRVIDQREGDLAALKVLQPALATWENVRRRIASEAVTMTLLRHPHVARVRDMGTDEATGLCYVAMDWVPGGSAAERCKREGPLPLPLVARWGVELASALSVAHDRGIVHRDVKPGNVLIGASGEALLTDFGVAFVPDADHDTEVDAVLGSMAYMAPEQRIRPHDVDGRTDLYALGATLFHLSTRRNPVDLFASESDDPRWSNTPADLLPIVFRVTRLRPGDRHATARDLARDLAPLVPTELWSLEPWLADWLG